MQLIDIGVNLTNKRLCSQLDDVLIQASNVGVGKMIVTGTCLESSQQAINLCQDYPKQLYCTSGVHPHDAAAWDSDSAKVLESLLEHDCVKAVGETGLDFNRNFSPQEKQIEVFQHQLEIASRSHKPVFLHQRDAFETFYTLLKEFRPLLKNAVVHCFTDNREALHALLDLDCHIGITGWICDERRGLELQSLVKDIPSNRLMLETDSPYLLPRDLPNKPSDKTNLPKYLPHILHTVAKLQGKPVEQLAQEVLLSTEHFFQL